MPRIPRSPSQTQLGLELFERYATGQEPDRTFAAWLNATGARTARGRQFGKDTVREMLCNAAHAGYVSGLRDKSRAIKGLREALVTDELFDRVQEARGWRTRVVKPGPPSDEYLLRELLRCEREQNGQIVAVQPDDDFLPYFQAIQHGAAPSGAEDGSDGTRTRDLCRDRAAL
jgi:hypothetical protein